MVRKCSFYDSEEPQKNVFLQLPILNVSTVMFFLFLCFFCDMASLTLVSLFDFLFSSFLLSNINAIQ